MAWLHGSDPPIIHRDLKPANMLVSFFFIFIFFCLFLIFIEFSKLDEHSKIKVCDFGLSHFMEDGLYDKEPKGYVFVPFAVSQHPKPTFFFILSR